VVSPDLAPVLRPADPENYYPGDGGRPHPGPAAVALPAPLRAAITAHARAELPNEACGLIVGDAPAATGGRPLRWEPTRNALASPSRYEIDAADLLRLSIAIDDAGEVIWGIVHSHVASPARPSPTDVRQSLYPDALYLLVSLDPDEARDGAPSLRGWRIVDGTVHEVEIVEPTAAEPTAAEPPASAEPGS
jgi:[CysO sulfur-carrier protein]-S-L-cysteine hydrolase